MCRHLAYLGPPVELADLLLDPPHSLLRQTWAPCDMRGGGTVNVDGFGVGWYLPDCARPLRHRSDRPMWTDQSFAGWARSVCSGAVLAAVRSASPGMPVVETACAPFTDEEWLFSHNGVVRGWPDTMVEPAAELTTTELLTLDAPTDSAALWALVRRKLREGQSAAKSIVDVVSRVAAVAPNSRLNLLLTNGSEIVGTAWSHALHVRSRPGAVTVSSEPLDDQPGWREIPDRHLVVATPDDLEITPITAHDED